MSSPKRVLIIEDDATVARLLTEILTEEGFETSVASDGLEGLLGLQTAIVDIAVLDIMMPNVNGVRVLEQMMEDGDGQLRTPVIVMTGSPDGAARARDVIGAENVFEKPFDPEALIDAIRRRLEA